jgi:eukaryotic-like serine/threonine-protein kinase
LDTILNSAVLAAIRAMQEARPLDFCENMELSPPYYRGLAYLEGRQFPEAIKEFQRVIDHRVIAPNSLYITLAKMLIGRAFQLEGDKTHAAQAYSEPEKVWKEADPDFPPLQMLRTYLRELNR